MGNALAPAVPVRYALIFLLLAGCGGGKSPEEKLLKDVEPAVSWVATLQLAGEKWLGNSVPTRFGTSSGAMLSARAARSSACRVARRSSDCFNVGDSLRESLPARGASGLLWGGRG